MSNRLHTYILKQFKTLSFSIICCKLLIVKHASFLFGLLKTTFGLLLIPRSFLTGYCIYIYVHEQ